MIRDIDSRYFVDLVGDKRAATLLSASKLDCESGEFPSRLHPATFWRLCAENIQHHDDESHGIAAEPVPRGSISVLFSATKEADTLAEALSRFAATARLIRKECRFTVGRSRNALLFTALPAEPGGVRAEIYVECFVIVIHCALRWMTGRRLDPLMVRGSAQLAHLGDGLLAALHVPVRRSGEGVTIHYDLKDARAPILSQKYTAWGDQEFESFRAMLEEDPEQTAAIPNPARAAVTQLLNQGMDCETMVAERLNLSVATLRRHLSLEGTSFRQMLMQARRAQLQNMLATDIPIADISEKLKFSDERSLRRFCHACFGVSPRQYRQILRGQES